MMMMMKTKIVMKIYVICVKMKFHPIDIMK